MDECRNLDESSEANHDVNLVNEMDESTFKTLPNSSRKHSKRLSEKNPSNSQPEYMKQLIPKKRKKQSQNEGGKKSIVRVKKRKVELHSTESNANEEVREEILGTDDQDSVPEDESNDKTNAVEDTTKYGSFYCYACDSLFNTFFQLFDHVFLEHKVHPMNYSYCNSCGTAFIDANHAKKHADRMAIIMPENPFECDICRMGFTSRYLLDFHMQGHTNQSLIQCGTCDEIFGNRCLDYVKHFKTHLKHFEKEKSAMETKGEFTANFLCTVCDSTYSTPSDFYFHMNSHCEDCISICYNCGSGFSNGYLFTKHKLIHESNPNQLPYQCDVCPEKFVSTDLLLIHKSMNHLGINIFKCDKCQATFKKGGNLYYHKLDPLIAKGCGKKYKGRRPPLASRENKRFFKDLEIGCSTSENFMYRESERENKAEYGVHITCFDLVHTNKNNLDIHLSKKLAQRYDVFKCHYCDVPTYNFKALFFHLRKHKLRGFDICAVCGLGLSRTQMSVHKVYHIEENFELLYHCGLCSDKFLYVDLLDLHIKVKHQGQSVLKCEYCQKEFNTRSSYASHNCLTPQLLNTRIPQGVIDFSKNKFPCRFPHCKKKKQTMTLSTLKSHEEEHHFLICHICYQEFQTRTCFEKHKKEHKEEYPYKCGICRKVLPDVQSLIHHVNLHNLVKDCAAYLCTICSRLFTSRNEFEKHKQEHAYKYCKQCQKKLYINDIDWKHHMSVCKPGKKFSDEVKNVENEDENNDVDERLAKNAKRRELRKNKKIYLFKANQYKDLKIYGLLEKIDETEKQLQDQRQKEKENPLHMFSRIIDDAIDRNRQDAEKQLDIDLNADSCQSEEHVGVVDNKDDFNHDCSIKGLNTNNPEDNDMDDDNYIHVDDKMLHEDAVHAIMSTESRKQIETTFSEKDDCLQEANPKEIKPSKQLLLPVMKDGKIVSVLEYAVSKETNIITEENSSDKTKNVPLKISIPNRLEVAKDTFKIPLSVVRDEKKVELESFQIDASQLIKADSEDKRTSFVIPLSKEENLNNQLTFKLKSTFKPWELGEKILKGSNESKTDLEPQTDKNMVEGIDEPAENTSTGITGEKDDDPVDHVQEVINTVAKEDFVPIIKQKAEKSVTQTSHENVGVRGVSVNGSKTRSRTTKMSSKYSEFQISGDKVFYKQKKPIAHVKGGKKKMERKNSRGLIHVDMAKQTNTCSDASEKCDSKNVAAGNSRLWTEKKESDDIVGNFQDMSAEGDTYHSPQNSEEQCSAPNKSQKVVLSRVDGTITSKVPSKSAMVANIKKMKDPVQASSSHNTDPDEVELMFRCNHCDVIFKKHQHLLLHLDSKHKGRTTFLCLSCGKGFIMRATKEKSILQQQKDHIRSHKVIEGKWYCRKCKKNFKNKAFYDMHKLYEHNPKQLLYECDICLVTFLLFRNFSKHYKQCLASRYKKAWNARFGMENNENDTGKESSDTHGNLTGSKAVSEACGRRGSDLDADGRTGMEIEFRRCLSGEQGTCTNHEYSDKNLSTETGLLNQESKIVFARDITITPTRKAKTISKLLIKKIVKKSPKTQGYVKYVGAIQYEKKSTAHFLNTFDVELTEMPDFSLIFTDRDFYTFDMGKEHTDKSRGDPNGNFHCEICGFKCKYYGDLCLHLYQHESGTNTRSTTTKICLHCGVGSVVSVHFFKAKWKVQHDSGSAHSGIALPYNCSVCNEQFLKPEFLELHETTHKGRQLLTCICGKDFRPSNRSLYVKHVKNKDCKQLQEKYLSSTTSLTCMRSEDRNKLNSSQGLDRDDIIIETPITSDKASGNPIRDLNGHSIDRVNQQVINSSLVTPSETQCSLVETVDSKPTCKHSAPHNTIMVKGEKNSDSTCSVEPPNTGVSLKETKTKCGHRLQVKTDTELSSGEKLKWKKYKLLQKALNYSRKKKDKAINANGIHCKICNKFILYRLGRMCEHGREYEYTNGQVCKECGKCFNSKHTLICHMQRIHKERKHHCKLCGTRLGLYTDFLLHMKKVHNLDESNQYNTTIDGQEHGYSKSENVYSQAVEDGLKYAETMETEIRDESNYKDYYHRVGQKWLCKKCGMIFKCQKNIYRHVVREHVLEKKYKCPHCEKGFAQQRDLYAHIKDVHPKKKFICQFCGNVHRSERGLKGHLLRLHKDVYIPPKKIKCFYCPEKFAFLRDYFNHKKEVHSNIIFSCNVCGMKLASARGVRKHKESRHGIKTYNLQTNQHSDKSLIKWRRAFAAMELEDLSIRHSTDADDTVLFAQSLIQDLHNRSLSQSNHISDIPVSDESYGVEATVSKLFQRISTWSDPNKTGLNHHTSRDGNLDSKTLEKSPKKREDIDNNKALSTGGKKKPIPLGAMQISPVRKNDSKLNANPCLRVSKPNENLLKQLEKPNYSYEKQVSIGKTHSHVTSNMNVSEFKEMNTTAGTGHAENDNEKMEEIQDSSCLEDIKTDEFVICDRCGIVAYDMAKLRKHKRHCQKHKYSCNLCGFVCYNYSQARKHKKKEHTRCKFINFCFSIIPLSNNEEESEEKNEMISGLDMESEFVFHADNVINDHPDKSPNFSDHDQYQYEDGNDENEMSDNELDSFHSDAISFSTSLFSAVKNQAIYTAVRVDGPQKKLNFDEIEKTSIPSNLDTSDLEKDITKINMPNFDEFHNTSSSATCVTSSLEKDMTFSYNQLSSSCLGIVNSESDLESLLQSVSKICQDGYEDNQIQPEFPETDQHDKTTTDSLKSNIKNTFVKDKPQILISSTKFPTQKKPIYLSGVEYIPPWRKEEALVKNIRGQPSTSNDDLGIIATQKRADVAHCSLNHETTGNSLANSDTVVNACTDMSDSTSKQTDMLDTKEKDHNVKPHSNTCGEIDVVVSTNGEFDIKKHFLPTEDRKSINLNCTSSGSHGSVENIEFQDVGNVGMEDEPIVLSDKTNKLNTQLQKSSMHGNSGNSDEYFSKVQLRENDAPVMENSQTKQKEPNKDIEIQCDLGKPFTVKDVKGTNPSSFITMKKVEKSENDDYHEVVKVPPKRYEPFVKCVTVPKTKCDNKDHKVLVELPKGMEEINLQVMGMDKEGPDVFLYFNV